MKKIWGLNRVEKEVWEEKILISSNVKLTLIACTLLKPSDFCESLYTAISRLHQRLRYFSSITETCCMILIWISYRSTLVWVFSLHLALEESDLSKLNACVVGIFEYKFHMLRNDRFFEVEFDCFPATVSPLRSKGRNLLPGIAFFRICWEIIDFDFFWIPLWTIICRFKSYTSNTVQFSTWEINYHIWLMAVTKPFVPRLLSWQKEILSDFFTCLVAVLSVNSGPP